MSERHEALPLLGYPMGGVATSNTNTLHINKDGFPVLGFPPSGHPSRGSLSMA
jgi:hypothetical protein